MLASPRYSQSFERGLAILKAFSAECPVLGIADLADGLGMCRSTTHRYVITLVALGFLEQSASRKYRLAPRASDLGLAALQGAGLYEPVLPVLERLRRLTGYTAGLTMLDGTEIVYVQRARSRLKGQAQDALSQRVGVRLPTLATAAGKVLLAHLPTVELHELLDELKVMGCTAAMIRSPARLVAELQRVHTEGCAYSDGELCAGLRAIAVPACDAGGKVVAAVDTTVYADALCMSQLDGFLPALRAAAGRLAGVLPQDREIQRLGRDVAPVMRRRK